MLTLGIDLASQPKWTSGCLIAWTSHDASVSCFALGLTDDDIVSLAQRADVVAIDAPFGWRAAALGLTIPASENDAVLARTEGRIAVPQVGTLNRLTEDQPQ